MSDLEKFQQKARELDLPESMASDLISAAFEGIVITHNNDDDTYTLRDYALKTYEHISRADVPAVLTTILDDWSS